MCESDIYQHVLSDLTDRYGEMIGGSALSKVLGYQSIAAMTMALNRKTLDIPTFFIPGRRGRFALTTEIAAWMAKHRAGASTLSKGVPENFKKKSGNDK